MDAWVGCDYMADACLVYVHMQNASLRTRICFGAYIALLHYDVYFLKDMRKLMNS